MLRLFLVTNRKAMNGGNIEIMMIQELVFHVIAINLIQPKMANGIRRQEQAKVVNKILLISLIHQPMLMLASLNQKFQLLVPLIKIPI
jgi:hypothetical protein